MVAICLADTCNAQTRASGASKRLPETEVPLATLPVKSYATRITTLVHIGVAGYAMRVTVEVAVNNVSCSASIRSVEGFAENIAFHAPSSALGSVSIWVGAKCRAEHPAIGCLVTNDVPKSWSAAISVHLFAERSVLVRNIAKYAVRLINGRRRLK